MTRLYWTTATAALLAVLFVTCQAKGTGGVESVGVSEIEEIAAIEPAGTEALPQDEKPVPKTPPKTPPKKKTAEKPVAKTTPGGKESGKGQEYAPNAFPPVVSDVDYHKGAWMKNDCLRCHETGVGEATEVEHKDMPDILLTAKCRSCHLLIRGQLPIEKKKSADDKYAINAFPPMIPASVSHKDSWTNDSCLLCHEGGGVKNAPVVKHKDMPKLLLKAKCRSCHVQVRRPVVVGR
jgi:hypothetical protein